MNKCTFSILKLENLCELLKVAKYLKGSFLATVHWLNGITYFANLNPVYIQTLLPKVSSLPRKSQAETVEKATNYFPYHLLKN